MRSAFLCTLALGLLVIGEQVLAQLVPDLGPVVQTVTDRQAERIQQQAVERVQQQAEAAQTRVAEQTQQQQVETIQNRIVDRVESQVERAQAQTTERAQNQIERVQNQVERTQSQLERVQNQALERAQSRVEGAERPAGEVPQRRLEVVPEPFQRAGAVAEDAARGLAAAADEAGGALPEAAGALPDAPARRLVPDPDGNSVFVEITIEPGIRAVEFEWVMLVTPAERQQLNDEAGALLDFLAGTQPFALTEGELLTFRVPPDLDANDAILQLVPENLRGLIDRNHLYNTQDAEADVHAGSIGAAVLALPMAAVCEQPVVVGMIDSAIDTDHAAFGRRTRSRIRSRSFVEAPLVPSLAHGTAVASLLVGEQKATDSDAQLRPLLPRATLYSAAVFHANEDAEQGATVMRVLAALDWLVGQDDVDVINMSLAGPPNRLLAQAVAAATRQGKVVVAAAGNEGAHGPLRYPAAYEDVVGVTAVDRAMAIYRWANQGPHIDYAALGVDVPAARVGGGIGLESGTSLAAPVVAAFFACALAESQDLDGALASLQARLVDPGEPGADPVYGKGLLHP